MYRYFTPRKDGTLKCSPKALELYRSETGSILAYYCMTDECVCVCINMHVCYCMRIPGEALRTLLLKHGDFKTVEVHAKKYHRKLHTKKIEAGWYTRSHLMSICAWTKP